MLEQLLDEIRKGGIQQPNKLAEHLNVSTAMVEAMLDSLEKMGMLEKITENCSKPCGGCPLSSFCGSQGEKSKLWLLVEHKTG